MRIGEARTEPAALPPATSRDRTTRGDELPRSLSPSDEEPSPFARILRGLGREVDRGESMVRRAIGGGGGAAGELGPTELLALQAGVYRYSEAVDLSAKLVDRATNGVKTVIQGQ